MPELVLPVSVVIPAFRRAGMVAAAIASALAQSPSPQEVVVVDDASGDDTADAAETAGARVVRLTVNVGEGGARTAGVAAATCPWVAFLDSDDEWLPGHLARVWGARAGHVLVSEGGVGSVSGRRFGNPGTRARPLRTPADLMWPDNPVVVSTVLADREAVLRAGAFGARPLAGDLAAWMALLGQGSGVVLPTAGALYREHDGQLSGDRAGMWRSVADLLDEHSGEDWCTAGLRDRVRAQHDWDRLRAAQAAGDRAAVRRAAVALARNPRTAQAMPSLLWWRRTQRRAA